MIGKSRRSKRRKITPGTAAVGSPNAAQGKPPTSAKVVSLANRRQRRIKRPANLETTAIPEPSKTRPSRSRPAARNNRRFRLKLPKPILYPLRFIIVGVGIGAFIGTLLAISNSRPYLNVTKNVAPASIENPAPAASEPVDPLPLKTPLTALTEAVTQEIAANRQFELDATMLFVDLDSGEYLDVGGTQPVSAASTIKIPVLVAFLEAIDAGTVKLDDTLTLTKEVIGTGAGELQYKPLGSTYSALDVATVMSTKSDNTATNMIIEQLGGIEAVNKRFQDWGIQQTVINNPLPDLEGTNLTTAKDLAYLLARINQGEILSNRSRDRLFRIMGQTENDRLLPQSLGDNADIVHKTGDIGVIIGDAGIVDMPNGKRYIASIFVKRPYDDPKGKELLHKIAKQFYDYLDKGVQPQAPAKPPSSSPAPTAPPVNTAPANPTEPPPQAIAPRYAPYI